MILPTSSVLLVPFLHLYPGYHLFILPSLFATKHFSASFADFFFFFFFFPNILILECPKVKSLLSPSLHTLTWWLIPIKFHRYKHYVYADNSQMYISIPDLSLELQTSISHCLLDPYTWMSHLKPNAFVSGLLLSFVYHRPLMTTSILPAHIWFQLQPQWMVLGSLTLILHRQCPISSKHHIFSHLPQCLFQCHRNLLWSIPEMRDAKDKLQVIGTGRWWIKMPIFQTESSWRHFFFSMAWEGH